MNSIRRSPKRKARAAPLRWPAALRRGDTVSLVAPASPFERSRFRKAAQWLSARGYRVVYEPTVFTRKEGYLAGSETRRVREFLRAWNDRKSKAVFVARGGYGSMRLLGPEFRRFRFREPKLFMGLSDVTVLLNYIARKSNLVTIHGPVFAGELFERMSESSRNKIFRQLEGGRALTLRARRDYRVLIPGSFRGRLWGGNLSMVQATLGTSFEIPFRGSIVFLEDVHEPPYRLDRIFTHLALAGVFKKIGALLLGEITDLKGKPYPHSWLKQTLVRCLGGREIPVVSGLRIGHTRNDYALPIGAPCRIERNARRIRFAPLVKNLTGPQ